MQIVEIDFTGTAPLDDEVLEEQVSWLMSIWMNNGQVSKTDWLTYELPNGWRVVASIPEEGALGPRHDSVWATHKRAELFELGIQLTIRELGEDPQSATVCTCSEPSSYILYTHYLSLESPVRCGDCFQPVPPYRLAPTSVDETDSTGLLQWALDWRACDTLQMNCSTLERAGTREIRGHDSSLGKRGKALCQRLAENVGKPFYLFLYPPRRRKHRPCPSCSAEWRLAEEWHKFAYRCDTCRLVSMEGW